MLASEEEVWARFAKHNEEGEEEIVKFINIITHDIRDSPPTW